MGKTHENLRAAFSGEAKAAIRLKAYSAQAEKDGYPQIARLFKAVSEAETVHALRHLKNLKAVGGTEDNLKNSFESEQHINENEYPHFILDAVREGEKAAEIAFSQTRDVEETHSALYKKALDYLANDRVVDYFICGVCGYIAEDEAPERCPVCNSKKEVFFKV